MKLGELRKTLRDDPNARNCHICAWTATPRRAVYVMSGEHGQWYDCGEHPDEPNGKPLFKEDIGEWMLKHGLVLGKSEPEVPPGAPSDVTPRMVRVLKQVDEGTFDLSSYAAQREVIEIALKQLGDQGLIDYDVLKDSYTITALGRKELEGWI